MAVRPRHAPLAIVAALAFAGCQAEPGDQMDPAAGQADSADETTSNDETDEDRNLNDEDEQTPVDDDPDDPNGGDDHAPGGMWQQLAEAPIAPRINHSVTWTDGLAVVWGGEDQDTLEITADGAAFDPDTEEWQEVPQAPIEPRWAHEAVWTGDELLVWGGTAGPDHLAPCYRDGARFDPETSEWHAIADAPGEARCGGAVAWTDDELVVYGGYEGNGPPGPQDRHDDAVAYDPKTDDWRLLPAAPLEPRADAIAGWTGEEVVVYGGHAAAENGDGFAYLTDGAALDPETDDWRVIADSPLPELRGPQGVAIDDQLLVFGGQEPDPEEDGASTAMVIYDPAADTWEAGEDLPGTHTMTETTWTGDVLYALGSGPPADGGEAGQAEDPRVPPFLAYVADEDLWLPREEPPGGYRTHHAMAWTGTALIVWGGQAETEAPAGLRWDPPTEPTDPVPSEVSLSSHATEAPANLRHRIDALVLDHDGQGIVDVDVRFEVYRDGALVLSTDRDTRAALWDTGDDGTALLSYNADAQEGDTDLVVACPVPDEQPAQDEDTTCATDVEGTEFEPVGDDRPTAAVTVDWSATQPADDDPAGGDFFGEVIAIDPASERLEVQLLPQEESLGAFLAFEYAQPDVDVEVNDDPVSLAEFECAVEQTVEDHDAQQRITISLTPPGVMRYLLTTSSDVEACF
jgi:N-acetylneuraminic acid mutarotase